jgi:hypothetical protein
MGKLHHAMMGTAAVAIGTAAAIPGTLVNLAAAARRGALRPSVRHPARGRGSRSRTANGRDQIMSRSARVLMEGWVRVPATRTVSVSLLSYTYKNGGDMNYADFYQRSVVAPEQFWQDEAALIDWNTPFSQVLDYSRPPFARWFVGGRTNLSQRGGPLVRNPG